MKKLHREHPEIYENFYKSMKGQTHTKEVKEIIRQSKIGNKNPMCRPDVKEKHLKSVRRKKYRKLKREQSLNNPLLGKPSYLESFFKEELKKNNIKLTHQQDKKLKEFGGKTPDFFDEELKICFEITTRRKQYREKRTIFFNKLNWRCIVIHKNELLNKTDEVINVVKTEIIKRIEEIGVKPTFDITTEKNHNFVLDNGVLSHNCHPQLQ